MMKKEKTKSTNESQISGLKTLKELHKIAVCKSNSNVIHIDILREEAKKWIKNMSNRNFYNIIPTTKSWVMHFFNITEEELK